MEIKIEEKERKVEDMEGGKKKGNKNVRKAKER